VDIGVNWSVFKNPSQQQCSHEFILLLLCTVVSTFDLLHLYRAIQVCVCVWGGNGCAKVHQQPILGMCSTDIYFNNLYTYTRTLQTIKKFNKCYYGDKGIHCTVVKVQKNTTVSYNFILQYYYYSNSINLLLYHLLLTIVLKLFVSCTIYKK